MILCKAVRGLASLRKSRQGRGNVSGGNGGSHATAQGRSALTAASTMDASVRCTSAGSQKGAITNGRVGGGVLLDGDSDGIPPETKAAVSSGGDSLGDQLKGLCGQQERLLGSQATLVAALVESQAKLVKCLDEQGREILSVGKKIKAVSDKFAIQDVSGTSVVDHGEEESGGEEAGGACAKEGVPDGTKDVENCGGSKGGEFQDEFVGLNKPAAATSSHLGQSSTDRTRVYRAKKRKRNRRNRRRRKGVVAPVTKGQGKAKEGDGITHNDAQGGGTNFSRVAKFLGATTGLFVALSGLAADGNGLATLGYPLAEGPPILLDQEIQPTNLRSSEPGKSTDPFDAHGKEGPPMDSAGGAKFWEAFAKINKQGDQQPTIKVESKKTLGSINRIFDGRASPAMGSSAKYKLQNDGMGSLPPFKKKNRQKISNRNVKISQTARMGGGVPPEKALVSKDKAGGPGPRILRETDLSVLYYFDEARGACSFDSSGRPDPSDGNVLLHGSIEECCEAKFPQGVARSMCTAFSSAPPKTEGSIFDPSSPTTEPFQTAPLPTVSARPTIISEGSTPTGHATASPGTASPSETNSASIGNVVSNEPTYVPTGAGVLLAPHPSSPFEDVNIYCIPDPSKCGCNALFGSDYRGPINNTRSGLACHWWASFLDTKPMLQDIWHLYEGKEVYTHLNHCRNPTDDPNGPWCYTKDDGSEWDYCDVPACETNVCHADPMTCGCPHLSQDDYRGFINTTSSVLFIQEDKIGSGLPCARWDENLGPEELLDGLDGNFCRNPDGDGDGPWCWISEDKEFGYCNVPACDTSSYICNASPDTCGCLDLRGNDYRGSINITQSGLLCLRWDALYDADELEQYSNFGLDGNSCRNPDNDARGPWCFTSEETREYGYCDVPVCSARTASPIPSGPTASPLPTAGPSDTSSPTQTCQAADKTKCGCDDVDQSDYRGTIARTRVGLECITWDSEQFRASMGFDALENWPESGLEGNFCRSLSSTTPPQCYTAVPFESESGPENHQRYCNIPACPACSCQPPCEQPNEAECGCPSALQAENCCEDGDASCKCRYLKTACSKSIEGGSEEFCDIAEAECCKGKNDSHCKCHMYDQICSEFADQTTCDFAAGRCCAFGDEIEMNACLCDFYSHLEDTIDLEFQDQAGYCLSKELYLTRWSSRNSEREMLKNFHVSTGGDSWLNDAGWLSEDTSHCNWFGVTCNKERQVDGINLRGNNLTVFPGEEPFHWLSRLSMLTELDLAENKLSGNMTHSGYLPLNSLRNVDLSSNLFSGHIDMSLFPSASYINVTQNKLNSVSFTPLIFKRDVAVHNLLRVVDLSNNLIDQEILEVFIDIPLSLERFILSNNAISGHLPNPLPALERLEILLMDNNHLNGSLPDFHRSTASLRQLDLSNQANGGLSGPLPATLAKLDDISILNLAGNNFSLAIPDTFGSFDRIKILNLSSNALGQSIPPMFSRLQGTIEVLDLSTNNLIGTIPSELGQLEGILLRFSGNSDLSNPAPLTLCFSPNSMFDLKNDTDMCPPERNALKHFYDSAKGQEWTKDDLWGDEYASHCSWYGVTCESTNKSTTMLVLPSNGLSGTLSEKIAELVSLEVLDVSDNGINGPIPNSIGRLSSLTKLMLKYNAFSDNVPIELGELTNLETIQLQSNELTGEVPHVTVADPNNVSSFISDCGYPSDFKEALVCDNCTACCNNEGGCIPTANNPVQKAGFRDYMMFAATFLGIIFAACAALSFVVFAFDRYRMDQAFASSADKSISRTRFTFQSISRKRFTLQQSALHEEEDREYAKKSIGDESVYCFFMGNSPLGWLIVVLTVAVQMWLLFVFVKGAEIDWTNAVVDFVYQFKCPKDLEECESTSDLSPQGWALFSILMVAYLLKDAINGAKLLVLSGQEREKGRSRIRYFFGGSILIGSLHLLCSFL